MIPPASDHPRGEPVAQGRHDLEDPAGHQEARQEQRQGRRRRRHRRNRSPTTIDSTPESSSRKNPLQPRHQNAPTASATPPRRSSTPIATAAASEAITAEPRATVPRTTSADAQDHEPEPVAPQGIQLVAQFSAKRREDGTTLNIDTHRAGSSLRRSVGLRSTRGMSVLSGCSSMGFEPTVVIMAPVLSVSGPQPW